eukprot:scaffold589555_cov39-Prasinocladus_malaysianus.AAC.1
MISQIVSGDAVGLIKHHQRCAGAKGHRQPTSDRPSCLLKRLEKLADRSRPAGRSGRSGVPAADVLGPRIKDFIPSRYG